MSHKAKSDGYPGFLALFYSKGDIHQWLFIVAMIVILLSGRILAKNKFWKFKVLWLNLIFVFIIRVLCGFILSNIA